MSNDNNKDKAPKDDRSTLDDLAQRTRIERMVQDSKKHQASKQRQEEEPNEQEEEPDEDDWSHLNHLN